MLGLSKALILRPRLLLIDELSLGLAPVIVGQLLEMVRAHQRRRHRRRARRAVASTSRSTSSTTPTSWRRARCASTVAPTSCSRATTCCAPSSCRAREPHDDGAAGSGDDLTRQPRACRGDRLRKPLLQFAVFVAVVALAKVCFAILDEHHIVQASTPFPVIVLGAIIGMTYGLLGGRPGADLPDQPDHQLRPRPDRRVRGGVLRPRCGQVARSLLGRVPDGARACPRATGAAAETGVVRRLRNAPRLMSIVATLGVGQFLVFFAARHQLDSVGRLALSAAVVAAGVRRRRAAGDAGLLRHADPVADRRARRSRCSSSGRGSAWRCAPRRPTRRPRGCPASSRAGCRRSRGRSPARSSAFTAILTAPTQGFVSGDSFGPVAAAARPDGRGDRPDAEPADRARRRRRPRRPRAAAALELPAVRPRRGGAVRHHPGGAAAAAPARRSRRGEGQLGRGPGVCARSRSGCSSSGQSVRMGPLVGDRRRRGARGAAAVHHQQPVGHVHRHHRLRRSSACRSASSPASAAS